MKTISNIVKLIVALSTLAAAIYVIATYGDKVVAFCKKVHSLCPCKCKDCAPVEEETEEEAAAPAEEAPAEEAPAEAAPAEEAPAAANDGAPVAEDSDFVK